MGIQPDILLCRTEISIPIEQKTKIALFCNVKPEAVIEAIDASSIYEVPISYHKQGLDHQVCKHFNLNLDEQIFTSSYVFPHVIFWIASRLSVKKDEHRWTILRKDK